MTYVSFCGKASSRPLVKVFGTGVAIGFCGQKVFDIFFNTIGGNRVPDRRTKTIAFNPYQADTDTAVAYELACKAAEKPLPRLTR